jgi:cbb3-type cytochrome oxidase maturation protein
MNVLVYLLPLALFLGALGLAGFVWSLHARQFEDLQGAGWRAIADDDLPEKDRKDKDMDGCVKLEH